MTELSPEQKREAIAMFNNGKTLQEIADHFKVLVYALSPWVYAGHLRY